MLPYQRSGVTEDQRARWPKHGPWNEEPDEVEFQRAGLDCAVLRVGWSGHLCGYVRLPEELVESFRAAEYSWEMANGQIRIHGGLTWRDYDCEGNMWVGFDCAHSQDASPRDYYLGQARTGSTYKTFAWVSDETRRLADQIAAIVQTNKALSGL